MRPRSPFCFTAFVDRQVSADGSSWSDVDGGATFTGNYDKSTKQNSRFASHVLARHVRLLPQTWKGWPHMRAGVIVPATTPCDDLEGPVCTRPAPAKTTYTDRASAEADGWSFASAGSVVAASSDGGCAAFMGYSGRQTDSYLSGSAAAGTTNFLSVAVAMEACDADNTCGGVTHDIANGEAAC